MKFVAGAIIFLCHAVAMFAAEPYEICTRIQTSKPLVALTFDGGPDPVNTPRILDALAEYGVCATFFVVGKRTAECSKILARMTEDGNEIGNNTWNDVRISGISPTEVANEIKKTNAAIADATGFLPGTFRPPYNAFTKALNKRIYEDFELRPVGFSIEAPDEKTVDAQTIADSIQKSVKRGDIIRLSDTASATVEALPLILRSLFAKGLEPVPASTLLASAADTTPIKKKPASAAPASR